MNYFNKIPTINYNGYSAKNLLTRAVISESTRKDNTSYYPYTIQEDDGRIDNLSQNYYDSPGYTWLIWHTNNIIDPYYGTSLNDEDLVSFIDSKYGSFSNAERTIAFYRINFATDSRVLTEAQYNGLLQSEKKYWDPQLDMNLLTVGYVRKKEPRVVNTNKIVRIEYESTNSISFIDEEKVSQSSSIWGWVNLIDTDSILLQHITGEFTVGATIQGEISGAVATITSVSIISETSAAENPLYWEAVSFAQFEQEENEKKRDILLLDSIYKSQIENELKRLMTAT
jgi:hypothetical protein